MTTHCLVLTLSLAAVAQDAGAVDDREFKAGLVYVFFNQSNFQRPARYGVQREIDMDVEGNDFAWLWLGKIRFPAGGEVKFLADADSGVNLFVGETTVIEGPTPDGPREGKIRVAEEQVLPVRVEYFQMGGACRFRLEWEWEGRGPEPIPSSALWHEDKDVQFAEAIVEGRQSTFPHGGTPVVLAPAGDEEFASSIYQRGQPPSDRPAGPIRLNRGPHLLIDDFLIAQSTGVRRCVNQPPRDPKIPNPLITGKGDECVAPYMTVLRDPGTGRFQIWYNVYKEKHKDGTARFATMESEDGIHWVRPRRVLEDPGTINFGCAVIDEGPGFADLAKRYKLGWWSDGGLKLAISADGLDWTLWKPYPVVRHNHDINNVLRDTSRNRYLATLSVYTTGPTWSGQRRVTLHSASPDLLEWEKPWYVLTPVDGVDEGQTQFYAMNGYLQRGDLLIGLVKVLRDDLRAPGTPDGAFGVGYTTLAWTRDGRHWVRDREPFFEPDPGVKAWDHAHAWLDYQLPVGDQIYIYYGGYKYGHKMDRWEGRQIGLVTMPRDRYIAREAGPEGGTLRTPLVVLPAGQMTVNARVNGELRVRLLDADGKPIPGYDAGDCTPVTGDGLALDIDWKAPLAELGGRPVQVEFLLRDAQLFSFDLAN
jgi:hypothetical protein